MARWRQLRPAAAWVSLLVAVSLAVLAGCIYVLPRILVPDRSAASIAAVDDAAKRLELEDARLKQRNDVRTTLLQGLAGAVVAVGLSLTWRQIRVNQEGQITERFNKAVDHLGSDTLDLRLGGIYALERIAKNSKEDRETIAEILTAFVRERSPWPPSQPGQYRDSVPIDQQPELRTRAADIQAVLTVLGRGSFPRHTGLRLDLGEVDLRRANLRDADLHAAGLFKANLQDARLNSANLQDARLNGANLQDAYLGGANLQDARLRDANLERANLTGANLQDARLNGANLQLTYLRGVNLRDAHLAGTSLQDANLSGARLEGADLTGAHLTGVVAKGAVADGHTKWPDGFDPASEGVEVGE